MHLFKSLIGLTILLLGSSSPSNWHIHNAFHVSLLEPYKAKPPIHSIQEEPPTFDDEEGILELEEILRHEKNILRSGKAIHRYLIKLKHYPPQDAQWMQETQLKDNSILLKDYKVLHQLQDSM